ncbi:MAG: hypothetical protein Q3X94_09165, partial [Oscillospiraceae bacterium]|nr:hypothetical protein [Oscillospiraceae bacterium]
IVNPVEKCKPFCEDFEENTQKAVWNDKKNVQCLQHRNTLGKNDEKAAGERPGAAACSRETLML